MELLWTSLTEWLIILESEIDINEQILIKESSNKVGDRTSKDSGVGTLDSKSSKAGLLYNDIGQDKSEHHSEKTKLNNTSNNSLPQMSWLHGHAKTESGISRESGISVNSEGNEDSETGTISKRWSSGSGESLKQMFSSKVNTPQISAELEKLSLDDREQDIVGAIAPRICAVIQAFYICCAGQSQQGWVV